MPRWKIHGRRTIHESPWVSLDLVDIEQPDGPRYEQHVVRMARPVAATVITRDGNALLMWRHRHVTDTWGWENPSGRIEEGESPEEAAAREAVEETGWRYTGNPGQLCNGAPGLGVPNLASSPSASPASGNPAADKKRAGPSRFA